MKSIINKYMIYLLLLMLSINAFAQVRLGGNPEEINLFALSPDGETLAGSKFFGTIHLWDSTTGAEKDVLISEFTIGDGAVLTFSPDSTLLASGSEKSKVTLWDVATGEAKFVLEHVGANTISSISFSPDGTTLASCAAGRWGTSSTFIYLWDVETGKKKTEIEVPELPMSCTFSPDGTTLAIGTTGFGNKAVSVYLWDIQENVEITKLEIVTPEIPRGVRYVAFSPDGTTLAAGIRVNLQIILWDVVSRKETGRLHGYYPVWNNITFAFSPDGMILAGIGGTAVAVDANHTAVDVDGLCLWDILNEKKKIISEPSMFAGVSPDGTFYAVEIQQEEIDGNNTNSYFIRTISSEDVFMDISAHGKLTTRWSHLKMSE